MPPVLPPPPMRPPGMPPGLPSGATQGDAMAALGRLSPKSPNPTVAIKWIQDGLDLMLKLVNALAPQVQSMNPKVEKDLHAIGQRIITAKTDLTKEQPLGPPPDLMLGMGGGMPPPPPMPGGMGGQP